MSYKIVHCSIDENNKGRNGKAGDQTKKECCIRSFYSKPWTMCIRYKDHNLAERASEIGIKLANSDLVGYDKNQRNTLYKQLELNNWDVDKYIKSGVVSEADCSSFVYAIWCCLLPELRGRNNAPTTAMAKSYYSKYGFDILTDKKYIKSGDYNYKGDMLNKPSGHIVMCIDDGKMLNKENTNTDNELNYRIAKEVIKGKWGNGNIRKKRLREAGYNYRVIQDIVNDLLK